MKLVTAPVPRPVAKRRQTTKKAWSAIGRAAARASSAKRVPTSSDVRRPQSARNTSAPSGIASVTTPFTSVPQAQATMPSSSTRQRMTASPTTLPSAYPAAAVP